ncbi:MAG: alpha/beta hydrolase [Lachnospiraceae bacterium]|nr:alpha/beta hydrolase [Lachnospiraceae bacterium]
MKIAVIFPGIGYHADKPLLYYSGKLARSLGYEVIPLSYGGFPKKIAGDRVRMEQSFRIAMEQAEDILKKTDWENAKDILFLSKSIGTVVAGAYARRHLADRQDQILQVLYTPVEATFDYICGRAEAFHGTADPWVTDEIVENRCSQLGIPLHVYPDANHSLETGDVRKDLRNMISIIEQTYSFITSQE